MKPRVLLDCDGILSDFVRAYLYILYLDFGIRAEPEQVTSFDIGASLGLTAEQSAAMKRAIGNERDLAQNLHIYPGAVDGLRRLQEVADVYIVTSPWNSNPTWTHDREWWLRQHFGIPHSRVVHTSAKHLVRGDFLIDDKTSTLVEWQAENDGTAIQWQTPHNRLDVWMGLSTCSWDELCEAVRS